MINSIKMTIPRLQQDRCSQSISGAATASLTTGADMTNHGFEGLSKALRKPQGDPPANNGIRFHASRIHITQQVTEKWL